GKAIGLLAGELDRALAPASHAHDGFQRGGLARAIAPEERHTSPSRTSKSMPCRMCDSPYQAFSRRTSSRLGMPCSEIGLDDAGILRHRVVVALGQDFAALEHGDPLAK